MPSFLAAVLIVQVAAGATDVREGASVEDTACLRRLDEEQIAYKRVPGAGWMQTPIEIAGAIGGVKLIARGRRTAVMDCVLASALARAGEVFRELGISGLTFSAAFDHRTRRGSNEPSAHAYGLAIDVHTVRGSFGEYDVKQFFERGVGLWRGLKKDPQALDACIGQPATNEGRGLRRLACRLKLHPAFRVIVTPDDDADHQDHLHLEAKSTFFPPSKTAGGVGFPPLPATPLPSAPATDTKATLDPARGQSSVSKAQDPTRKPPPQKKKKKKKKKNKQEKRTKKSKAKVKDEKNLKTAHQKRKIPSNAGD